MRLSEWVKLGEMKTSQQLLEKLETWCNQKYGRKTKVAKLLGVSPQVVNDWFVKDPNKRSMPTWDTGRNIEEFVALPEHARRSRIKEKPTLNTPAFRSMRRNKARQKAVGEIHGK
jgi:predicted transcriptional regulator